jgi:hypothetical protein
MWIPPTLTGTLHTPLIPSPPAGQRALSVRCCVASLALAWTSLRFGCDAVLGVGNGFVMRNARVIGRAIHGSNDGVACCL